MSCRSDSPGSLADVRAAGGTIGHCEGRGESEVDKPRSDKRGALLCKSCSQELHALTSKSIEPGHTATKG